MNKPRNDFAKPENPEKVPVPDHIFKTYLKRQSQLPQLNMPSALSLVYAIFSEPNIEWENLKNLELNDDQLAFLYRHVEQIHKANLVPVASPTEISETRKVLRSRYSVEPDLTSFEQNTTHFSTELLQKFWRGAMQESLLMLQKVIILVARLKNIHVRCFTQKDLIRLAHFVQLNWNICDDQTRAEIMQIFELFNNTLDKSQSLATEWRLSKGYLHRNSDGSKNEAVDNNGKEALQKLKSELVSAIELLPIFIEHEVGRNFIIKQLF